ncbi:MAG: hypothetical protein JNM84_22485 [Planctomycetes bacterium]|nr:hypothetical protein [Planctomycetota bacterium]
MGKRGRRSSRATWWVTFLALLAAIGLAWSLLAGSRAEVARRRCGELVRAIDEERWGALLELVDPELEAKSFEGSWPRAARGILRRFTRDEAALRALLDPLDLRLRLRSARAEEHDDGTVSVGAVIQVRSIGSESGMIPSPAAEAIRRQRPEVQVTTRWRERDGGFRLFSVDLASFDLVGELAQ